MIDYKLKEEKKLLDFLWKEFEKEQKKGKVLSKRTAFDYAFKSALFWNKKTEKPKEET